MIYIRKQEDTSMTEAKDAVVHRLVGIGDMCLRSQLYYWFKGVSWLCSPGTIYLVPEVSCSSPTGWTGVLGKVGCI